MLLSKRHIWQFYKIMMTQKKLASALSLVFLFLFLFISLHCLHFLPLLFSWLSLSLILLANKFSSLLSFCSFDFIQVVFWDSSKKKEAHRRRKSGGLCLVLWGIAKLFCGERVLVKSLISLLMKMRGEWMLVIGLIFFFWLTCC